MLGEIILSKYSVARVVQCIGVGLGATTAAVFLTEVTKFFISVKVWFPLVVLCRHGNFVNNVKKKTILLPLQYTAK